MPDALLSLAALEVACDEGVTPHLARLDEAMRTAPGAERLVLARVREALTIHLALLQRRPDALWPALYSHCAFVDSPRARTFDVSAPGPDMPVFMQVGRWLEERRALHPNTPWLKALTPTTPWGGSLVAELRGLEAPRVLGVTDDVVLIETKGQTRAWTWATGAIAEAVAPKPPPQPATRHPTGGLTIERGGQLTWLLDPAFWVRGLITSANGARVACVGSDIDESFAFVFDVATGRQLASVECDDVSELALSPNGAFLALRTREGVTCLQPVEGGGGTVGIASAIVTSVAVSVDGRKLAQVEDGVVRVWRPHPAPWPTPFLSRHSLWTGFSRDGASLLLAQFVLDGGDATVKARHEYTTGGWLEGGPAPFGIRLTRDRLCASLGFATEVLELSTGNARRLSEVRALLRQRVAWSGDGRVFAVCDHGGEKVTLHTPAGPREVQTSGSLEAIALDHTGSQLLLLHGDGTVELQAGGTRLRRLPGATGVMFLADDRAIAVGGPSSTVVLRLDGSECFRSSDRFVPTDDVAAVLEVKSGLRQPSIAEQLALTAQDGLLVAMLDEAHAVFPAPSADWRPSPAHTVLARGTSVLSWERA